MQVCYNETKVNQQDKRVGEQWRKYYRQRNCVWKGVDVQGTPLVQCVQTQEKGGIYRCKKVSEAAASPSAGCRLCSAVWCAKCHGF